MLYCSVLRIGLILLILLLEPITPNANMIVIIAFSMIIAMFATQRQIALAKHETMRHMLCQMKRDIIAAVSKSAEQ